MQQAKLANNRINTDLRRDAAQSGYPERWAYFQGIAKMQKDISVYTLVSLTTFFVLVPSLAMAEAVPSSNPVNPTPEPLISLGLTILIGTATGLVSSLFVNGAKQFILKVVIPWYENLIYKDAKIEGRWQAESVIDGENVERVWIITRQGHEITATVTSTNGNDRGQTYKMKGTFKNMVLTGSYEHTDPSSTDRGTYTLRLVRDGARLDGMIAASSADSGRVEASSYILNRVTRH